MKRIIIPFVALSLFSCKKEEEKKESLYPSSETISEGASLNLTPSQRIGEEIFNGKGNCFSCHKPDQKIIGPSAMEIAAIYKEKKGDMVQFLKGEGEPLVDPSQYEVMKTNFAITKNFTDEELKGLEDYFMTFSK
ncbi:cytochrome C552 [Flavobacterium sp. DG1-102-2]|uniref:c-type cytochrome n=1 Tax=Flavobacterium sp. DG1-102-2 TaxID=3081663 RepID=UPI0029492085|nr:c-type cytochrome [Flavobacterium sp. DG1-102-2]MDV6167675.1 cytochrome C552 [Flavobacterium sp. DG1-102-2]